MLRCTQNVNCAQPTASVTSFSTHIQLFVPASVHLYTDKPASDLLWTNLQLPVVWEFPYSDQWGTSNWPALTNHRPYFFIVRAGTEQVPGLESHMEAAHCLKNWNFWWMGGCSSVSFSAGAPVCICLSYVVSEFVTDGRGWNWPGGFAKDVYKKLSSPIL